MLYRSLARTLSTGGRIYGVSSVDSEFGSAAKACAAEQIGILTLLSLGVHVAGCLVPPVLLLVYLQVSAKAVASLNNSGSAWSTLAICSFNELLLAYPVPYDLPNLSSFSFSWLHIGDLKSF